MRRTIFFGSKLLGHRIAPEAEDFAVNQRNAVDWECVISEWLQVSQVNAQQLSRRFVQHL